MTEELVRVYSMHYSRDFENGWFEKTITFHVFRDGTTYRSVPVAVVPARRGKGARSLFAVLDESKEWIPS